jgi:hypothetical protein
MRLLLWSLALRATCGFTLLPAQQPPVGPGDYHDASLALRVSTLGPGLEMGKLLTGHLSVRVGANYFTVNRTQSQSDISFDASIKLQGISALVDLYPSGRGAFHLTGGIITNPLTFSGTGVPTSSGTFKINGDTYTSSQIGILTANGKFPSVGPYVGLGFGTPSRSGRRPFAFVFDLGAVVGKPRFELNATGAATDPQLAADIQAQTAKTKHDIHKFIKGYPVVSMGLVYRF